MTNTDTMELKPCPFCGSENVRLHGHVSAAQIRCHNCGAGCGGVYLDKVSGASLADKAATQWNTRIAALPPAVPDVETTAYLLLDCAAQLEHAHNSYNVLSDSESMGSSWSLAQECRRSAAAFGITGET